MLGFVAEKFMFPGPDPKIRHMNMNVDGNKILIERPGSKHVIMYAHGNTANVGVARRDLEKMATTVGVSVCLYEYPGYTEGQGSSQDQVNQAALDCYEWLHFVKEYEVSQIILMGRSIGSGPTLWLASNPHIDNKFGGIILWSAFTSIQDLGHVLFSEYWNKDTIPLWIKCLINPFTAYLATSRLVIGNRYDNMDAISSIHESVPVHFIHGRMDDVIPIECMETLKGAAPNAHLCSDHVQDYGNHNAFDFDRLVFSVVDFVNRLR